MVGFAAVQLKNMRKSVLLPLTSFDTRRSLISGVFFAICIVFMLIGIAVGNY